MKGGLHSTGILKRGHINPLRNLGRVPAIHANVYPPRALRVALSQNGIQQDDFSWSGVLLEKGSIDKDKRLPQHGHTRDQQTVSEQTAKTKTQTADRNLPERKKLVYDTVILPDGTPTVISWQKVIRLPSLSPIEGTGRGRKAHPTKGLTASKPKCMNNSPASRLFETIKRVTPKVDCGIDGSCDPPDEQLRSICWRANENYAKTQLILKQYPHVNVNARDQKGMTPLMIASIQGHVDSVELLLRHRGDPEAREKLNGYTCLHYSIAKKSFALAKLLLKWSANIDAQDNTGCTPLFYAVCSNHADSVSFLLSHRARVDLPNHCGTTPLMKSVQTNAGICHVMLLEKRANVRAKDGDGKTPLMYASAAGQLTCVEALLHLDGDLVNQVANDGTNALYVAAAEGHADVCAALISGGIHVDIRHTVCRQTPLMQACARGHMKATKSILDAGANTLLIDVEGKDALKIAESNGWRDLVHVVKRYMREDRLRLGMADILGPLAFRHGPLRGHPDAELLSQEIPAFRRTSRRVLTLKQKPFLKDHLKCWRAVALQRNIATRMFRACKARNIARTARRVRRRCIALLRAWKALTRHTARIRHLCAKKVDPHKDRRSKLQSVRQLLVSIEEHWWTRQLVDRWRKYVVTKKVSRAFAPAFFAASDRKNRVRAFKKCWQYWKHYHDRLSRGKEFLRLATYPSMRIALWHWQVGVTISKKETDLLFRILGNWYELARCSSRQVLRKKFFSRWWWQHAHTVKHRERILHAHTAAHFACRVQLYWHRWSEFHDQHSAARKLQATFRGRRGRILANAAKQMAAERKLVERAGQERRRIRAAEHRLRHAIRALEKLNVLEPTAWATQLLGTLASDARVGAEEKVFATKILIRRIHVKLQRLGLKCSRSQALDLLDSEGLGHVEELSIEAFIVFLMQVHRHRPGFLESLSSSKAIHNVQGTRQSVRAVGYKRLKW